MFFTRFTIKNFKGIEYMELDLQENSEGQVFTLVGLNESGKTTILEAISTFEASKAEEVLYSDTHKTSKAQDYVPKSKKSNFTGSISIEATLKVESEDKKKIARYLKEKHNFVINEDKLLNDLTIERRLDFQDSNHKKTTVYWNLKLIGKKARAQTEKNIYSSDAIWQDTTAFISTLVPAISYFPTFLFDFPARIYLEENDSEAKVNKYYRTVIQDVLDSLGENLDIQKHIVDRVKESNSEGNFFLNPLFLYRGDTKSQIDSVLLKIGDKITEVIFSAWNEIFNRKLKNKSIHVSFNTDTEKENPNSQKVYLEFFIKDGAHQYAISERSLGFRWFLCFLLFTQFRGFRKANRNALFLFDEPASNLHSGAQNQLLESFPKITKKKSSIIYSTHSHHMINPKWLENTYIIQNLGIDYDHENYEDSTARGTRIQAHKYKKFVADNPTKITYFQPILDRLDYRPSQLELLPDAVMLEGKLDFYAFSYFSNYIFPGEYKINFMPGLGANDLNGILSLYLGWGKNAVILLDGDKAGNDAKLTYQTEWLLPAETVFTLNEIDSNWSGITLEKLFSESDRNKITTSLGLGNSQKAKKAIARFIQEKASQEEVYQFDEATVENFRKVLEFCKDRLQRNSKTE